LETGAVESPPPPDIFLGYMLLVARNLLTLGPFFFLRFKNAGFLFPSLCGAALS